MNKCIEAIIFDLDGTLLDTAQDLANATNEVLTYHGYRTLSPESIRPLVGGGVAKIITDCFKIKVRDVKYKLIRQHIFESYQQQLTRNTDFFPGIPDVLNLLEKHQCPWGIVTNKPFWLAEPLVKSMANCHCLVGRETLPFRKPNPMPLLYAARYLRVSERTCVYVGDALTDIQAAKEANMYSIAAGYGYIDTNDLPQNWGANLLINTPLQLAEWLRQELEQ